MPRGEKNKLNDHQRMNIYKLKGKMSAYKVAEIYKVSHTTIYNIWNAQPPASYRDALLRIRTVLEKTRGHQMTAPVHEAWANISIIIQQALKEPLPEKEEP